MFGNRIVRIAAVVTLLLVLCPETGEAQIPVIDWSSILQLIEQITRMETQIRKLDSQLSDMVTNSRGYGGLQTTQIERDLQLFEQRLQWASGIAIQLANADQVFRARFPRYSGGSYQDQYRSWSTAVIDTMQAVIRAGNEQHRQIQTEQATVRGLTARAMSAEGRNQILQVQVAMAAEQVGQVQKLRELIMADMSAKQAYQAKEIQKKQAEEDAAQTFWSFTPKAENQRGMRIE